MKVPFVEGLLVDIGLEIKFREDAEMERRMLRHLLLSIVRNCFLGSKDLHADLDEGDLTSVIRLADCIEPIDVPIYFVLLMYICKNLPDERVRAQIPIHKPLVDLLIKYVFEFTTGGPASLHDEAGYEAGLYMFSWEETPLSEEEEEEEDDDGSSATGSATTDAAKSPQKTPKGGKEKE